MKCVARASARALGVVIAAIVPLCWAAAPAHAQFEVKSPAVEKGVLELEALGSVQSRFNDDDDDDQAETDDEAETVTGPRWTAEPRMRSSPRKSGARSASRWASCSG